MKFMPPPRGRFINLKEEEMKLAWKMLLILGVTVILIAFGIDTTVQTGYGRVHNIGLQSQQQMLLMLGGICFLAGVILFAAAKVKETPEDQTLADQKTQASRAAIQQKLGHISKQARFFWAKRNDHFLARIASLSFVLASLMMSVGFFDSSYHVFDILAFGALVIAFQARPALDARMQLHGANVGVMLAYIAYVLICIALETNGMFDSTLRGGEVLVLLAMPAVAAAWSAFSCYRINKLTKSVRPATLPPA
jgi:hypothetical protein